jgi:pimeloyl-ACP methyl ester carboxylesterase
MDTFDHQKGQHLDVDGAQIYYEEIGNPEKPTLLFLHGGFGNIEEFNSVVPHLVADFRIIGIDSRGHGKSTFGSELNYSRIQMDIETLLQSLQIDNVTIIGFSDGGTIAYRLAIESSIKINKIVTIGATWNIKDSISAEEIFRRITAESWKAKFPESFESYQKLNPAADFSKLTTSMVAMWLDATATGFPNENVSTIQSPTLIIRGDNDHLFSRGSVFEVAELITNSTLLNIPFAGHLAYVDQSEIFMKTLKQFLNN